jgi:hypothetical protein
MKNKIINTIICLAIGFVTGLFAVRGCGKKPVPPKIIKPAQIVQDLKTEQEPWEKKYDSVTALLLKKDSAAASVKVILATERKSRHLAEKELNVAINKLPAAHQPEVTAAAEDYINKSNLTDSLCEAAIAAQESRIALRDSLIKFNDSLYAVLQKKFYLSIDQQGVLLKYNGQIQKQIRKQKAGKWLWRAATAAAVIFYIKN